MDEKIKNLWANNKILFFLLIPLILVFVFHKVIFELLVGSAKGIAGDAKKEDDALKAVVNKANQEAAVAKAQADALDDQIKNRKESDIPLDWNKKKE